jgi:hypothetical protein
MHKPMESTLRIKVCKPSVWECKPTWEEQLKHDWLVSVARGHVDVFFYENLNEQIARRAAPAAANAAYAAVHFTSAVLARLEACEFRLPASEPIPRQLLYPGTRTSTSVSSSDSVGR